MRPYILGCSLCQLVGLAVVFACRRANVLARDVVEVEGMAALVGLVSQKGGVGKSTLARLIAREYAVAGWHVKIADLDISQGTSTDWKQRRERASIKPDIAVEPFGTVATGAESSAALRPGSFRWPAAFDGRNLGDCQSQRRGNPTDRS